MRLLGVKRKSDGEIVLVAEFGKRYKLPFGLKINEVDIVKIAVPEQLSLEEIKKAEEIQQQQLVQQKEIEDFAKDNKIGLGDLVYLLTSSTGFKKWWDDKHGGECAPCQEKQASWNYFRFTGPQFLKKLIKESKEPKK